MESSDRAPEKHVSAAGRRDDLWSWLYMLVEMLDGALPWRPEKGEDARDADAVDKEAAKEMAQELKGECLDDPKLLTTEVNCPGKPSPDLFLHSGSGDWTEATWCDRLVLLVRSVSWFTAVLGCLRQACTADSDRKEG